MLKRSFICCFIIYMAVSLKDFVKLAEKIVYGATLE